MALQRERSGRKQCEECGDDKNYRKGVNDWFMRSCLFRRNDSQERGEELDNEHKGEVKRQGENKHQRAASRVSTQRKDAVEQQGATERGANE